MTTFPDEQVLIHSVCNGRECCQRMPIAPRVGTSKHMWCEWTLPPLDLQPYPKVP